MSSLSKPREAALKALYRCEKDGAYLNIALRDILASSNMEPRDNALATNIAFGVMKNRLFLDNIIANISSIKLKKLSVWIINILRMGIFELRFLDRIPESATVNECVRLARRYGHSASGGFVNAVLRKAASSGDFLPDDTENDEYISIKYSMPLWLVDLWKSQGHSTELFKAMNDTPPVMVRLNTLKAKGLGEDFEKMADSEFSYRYTGSGSVENTEEFKSGAIAIQDGASQRAISAFGIENGMRVLDLCSAPGGKSAFMAQLMDNTGEVISCDIHSHKLTLIESNLKRLGVTNARVMLNDATVFCPEFADRFDAVLADVPCSGLGVIRRKSDIKWTKSEIGNDELVKIQRDILSNAVKYVKHGGKLMYSTCTINKIENEDNTKWILASFPEFFLIEQKQLMPHTDGTDGFFYAVFERK
ncbi:MAG: 16S rRNA (cytosine(967)-C(5))-methyltransferase RsmB [Clostridia bacterium]|nr:16S rRNA (cytosine(967)-C(5))-methyltransferase RsmB [Clostridia bacterium]